MFEIVLISIACGWFAGLSKIPTHMARFLFWIGIKKEVRIGNNQTAWVPVRIKPFDCEKCISFWAVLIYSAVMGFGWWSPIYAGCASLIAMLTVVIYNKIR